MSGKAGRPRVVTRYRLTWGRRGGQVKSRTFIALKSVEQRIGLLTSDEPWRFFGTADDRERDGDQLMCCDGSPHRECGCGGVTVREHAMAARKALPPVEWVKVEKRAVTFTPWETVREDRDLSPAAGTDLTAPETPVSSTPTISRDITDSDISALLADPS